MVAGYNLATRSDRSGLSAGLSAAGRAVWLRIGCAAFAASAAMLAPTSAAIAANTVQITKLTDVSFGTISTAADSVRGQNVCISSQTPTKGYNVRASGSGASNAFTLANGTKTLAYEVQWNSTSGQTTGTGLSPNIALTGLISSATKPTCSSGPATTASLIVVVRSVAASTASAGTYNGTLTLVFAPE